MVSIGKVLDALLKARQKKGYCIGWVGDRDIKTDIIWRVVYVSGKEVARFKTNESARCFIAGYDLAKGIE